MRSSRCAGKVATTLEVAMRFRFFPIVAVALIAPYTPTSAQPPQGIDKLSHILVIYLENRSFDHLFGEFLGADGISNAGSAAIQRNRAGEPYAKLPPVLDPFKVAKNPIGLYALPAIENLPNRLFAIDGLPYGVTVKTYTRDLIHAFYTNKAQINGGKNDRFVAYSNAGALTMGHYGEASLRDTNLWKLARDYRLLDNFFQGAFGGSFFNHIWLVCACAPEWPNPPASVRSKPNPGGSMDDESVTAVGDGEYAVNTTQSVFLNNGKKGGDLLPGQTKSTIGDRLTAKGVDWAWYSGGWNLAIKGNRSSEEEQILEKNLFQWHHQPFAYFERFSPMRQSGRDERAKHLKDAIELEADIRTGRLPPVAFYKPVGVLNQHPGYANLVEADEEVGRIVKLMQMSPMKESYAIIITYDEHGGFFDHVRPPQPADAGDRADFFGPGTRVPAILVSPFVRKGVDHSQYETTSISKFIADRHRLDALHSSRFKAVESLAKAFDFSR